MECFGYKDKKRENFRGSISDNCSDFNFNCWTNEDFVLNRCLANTDNFIRNGHLRFKAVEFQMQDVGALGYNKRTVEVFYLTPFFMITSEVPNDIDKRVEWIKVDKEVNELGLKFP